MMGKYKQRSICSSFAITIKKEQNKLLTDDRFPQFSGNSFANELFQARAGGSYLIKCSSSDNMWIFLLSFFFFFNLDFVNGSIQGQAC